MKKLILGAVALFALAAPAAAADLAARPYTKAPAYVDPAYNWSGFYIGLNAGGTWGRSDAATTTLDPPAQYFASTSPAAIAAAGAQRINSSGFTGGLTAGYNAQAGNVVYGVEADFNYLGLKKSASSTALYPCCAPTNFTVTSSTSTDWLITFRPRIGLAANNWLFYVTGGLAAANVKNNFNFTDTFSAATESASISKTKVGWTVGGGIEYALLNGWSVKAEYLYVDLGSESVTSNNLTLTGGSTRPLQTFTHDADLRANIVRAGFNYKFGGPVVAKY